MTLDDLVGNEKKILAAYRRASELDAGFVVVSELAATGYMAEAEVRHVIRLIDLSEHKRRKAAPGLSVTSRAFAGAKDSDCAGTR